MVINVNAIEYKAGIKKNDQLVWKCKVCNEAELNHIFGIGWNNKGIFQNLSKGSVMKWEINSIELNETVIQMNFSIWIWRKNRSWGDVDNISKSIFFKDPTNYPGNLNYSNYGSLVPFWFPIPVGEYIGNLNLISWYDVDNRVLPTLNIDVPKNGILPGFPNKSIQIIAIYNDRGILNSYKMYIKGNVVIIDIAFDSLPFYVLPSLIGLFAILSLGLVIFIIKKLKSAKIISVKLK